MRGENEISDVMKKRSWIVVFVLVVILAITVFVVSGPSAADFCTGSRRCELSRMEFRGQDRQATLSDLVSMAYLESLRKWDTCVPRNVETHSGLTFDVKLFGKWGSLGTIYVIV